MDIFDEIFEDIVNLLENRDIVILAIDGRCGSGKTTLSALLSLKFDCNIFHMDDFFLPADMRTAERLAVPGGNVHHERFLAEVLLPIRDRKPVCYRPFICSAMGFGEMKCFQRKKLNIVEGSYSLHPSLRESYDLKIFLTLDHKTQEERILKRSGASKLNDFINLWIPMEELYFREQDVERCCDIVVDTSSGLCPDVSKATGGK
jgi:uridine kinase